MKRAWLLARVSTTKSSQDSSPENQLTTLRAYCERKGWRVAGAGQDRMSGARFDRPALMEAMTAVRAGRADALCVTDLDRLGRDVRELLATADELRDRGVVLVVARLGDDSFVDTSTASGRVMFTMFAAFAEFFRGLYREKSMEGQQRAREKGKRIGRPREEVPPQVVRIGAELRAGGYSWRLVSMSLATSYGLRQPTRLLASGKTRPERRWPPSTLQRVITAHLALSKSGGANAQR